ncbi:hypothetical protein [Winogradskyella pelagia]|jgi:hypothetical protein|nr:hypothetical protein [Winogradskyella sp. DF17]
MNWDAVSAIAGRLGDIGVIITLDYAYPKEILNDPRFTQMKKDLK